jgi:hypothetical protein
MISVWVDAVGRQVIDQRSRDSTRLVALSGLNKIIEANLQFLRDNERHTYLRLFASGQLHVGRVTGRCGQKAGQSVYQ